MKASIDAGSSDPSLMVSAPGQPDGSTPAASSRRVKHNTHPWLRIRAATWRRTPPDASSIQWTSSTMTSTGPARSPHQERGNRPLQPPAANGIAEFGRLERRRELEAENHADQGQPRDELRRRRGRRRGQPPRGFLSICISEVECLQQQLPDHEVWSGRLVRLADDVQDAEVGGMSIGLGDQARLADAGLADDVDDATVAPPRVGQQAVEGDHLGLAPDQGPVLSRSCPVAAQAFDRADERRLDGL